MRARFNERRVRVVGQAFTLRAMRLLVVHAWLCLMLPLLGSCAELGCPCGASPSDPFSLHDPVFVGSHFLDAECVCRCGEGERFALPKTAACGEMEGACMDAEGRERSLDCE